MDERFHRRRHTPRARHRSRLRHGLLPGERATAKKSDRRRCRRRFAMAFFTFDFDQRQSTISSKFLPSRHRACDIFRDTARAFARSSAIFSASRQPLPRWSLIDIARAASSPPAADISRAGAAEMSYQLAASLSRRGASARTFTMLATIAARLHTRSAPLGGARHADTAGFAAPSARWCWSAMISRLSCTITQRQRRSLRDLHDSQRPTSFIGLMLRGHQYRGAISWRIL